MKDKVHITDLDQVDIEQNHACGMFKAVQAKSQQFYKHLQKHLQDNTHNSILSVHLTTPLSQLNEH